MASPSIPRYRILDRIGKGGMAEVFLARDHRLGRTVALKFPRFDSTSNPQRLRRFLQEAKAASALCHPNICVIYDAGKARDGRPYIAMEYVEGRPLDEMIEGRPMELSDITKIGAQLADALDEAHGKGIIHRDIKPGNIMINPKGQAKVLDFGLATFTTPDHECLPSRSSLRVDTGRGVTVGTLCYMSPEQLMGKELDGRTDIFSLGVVLYQMATGVLPFSGDTPAAITDEIIRKEPVPPNRFNTRLPVELENIIVKSLEKEREFRYRSAGDLLTDLKRLKRDSSSGQPSPSRAETAVVRTRVRGTPVRRSLPAALVAVLVLLLLVLLAVPRTRHAGLKWFGAHAVPREKRLVVLPIVNLTGKSETGSICDGLMEYLTTSLSLLEQSQQAFKIEPACEVRRQAITSVSEAFETVGATVVVSGSLLSQGETLRLTLNLINAEAREQVTGTMIDADAASVFTLQTDAVLELAKMLKLDIGPETRRRLRSGNTSVAGAFKLFLQGRGVLMAAGQDTVPTAYHSYLEGLGLLKRHGEPERLDAAIGFFKRAIEQDPLYALAHTGLAEAYLHKSRIAKDGNYLSLAEKSCSRALDLNDGLARPHVVLGEIHKAKGDFDRAVRDAESALELDPVNAAALCSLGGIYVSMDRLDEAEAVHKKAVVLRPADWAVYGELASFYCSQGRYEEAIDQFAAMLEMTPKNHIAQGGFGAVYLFLGRWDEARERLRRSLAIKPSYFAYSNLGSLDYFQGHYGEAASAYEHALKLEDKDYQVWGNLALAYYHLPGRTEQMQATARKAVRRTHGWLEEHPEDAVAHLDLAVDYLMLKQTADVLACLHKALSLSGQNVDVMVRAAEVYENLGDRKSALQWLDKALKQGYAKELIERDPAFKALCEDEEYKQF